jgi:hypothetical protein
MYLRREIYNDSANLNAPPMAIWNCAGARLNLTINKKTKFWIFLNRNRSESGPSCHGRGHAPFQACFLPFPQVFASGTQETRLGLRAAPFYVRLRNLVGRDVDVDGEEPQVGLVIWIPRPQAAVNALNAGIYMY